MAGWHNDVYSWDGIMTSVARVAIGRVCLGWHPRRL